MELNGKKVLVCTCEDTMDGGTLARACRAAGGTGEPTLHRHLCRGEIDAFAGALDAGGPLLVACTQEAPLFEELRAEKGAETAVAYANIRERAGWSEEGAEAAPKIAALLAEAALDIPPASTVPMASDGVVLVYGRDGRALEAAEQLAGRMDVTLLLSEAGDVVPPRIVEVPIFRGRISAAKGYFGAFEIVVDDYAPVSPSSRGSLVFEPARDGAMSKCDIILDLSGGAPLFPAPEARDGYFRPDPGNPAAVQKALFEITDLVGEFDKTRYVDFKGELCAHSRSGVVGCTRCLDLCPVSAIAPDGDRVAIDPHVCGGCGSCASVCPTGAASYALPPGDALFQRLRTLLGTYHAAGGRDAVLLVHDTGFGADAVSLTARFGRGLPARVLPFAVNEVTQVGFDFLAAALAYGAARVRILVPPDRRDRLAGLAEQIGLAETAMTGLGYGGDRVAVIDEADPEAIERALWSLEPVAGPKPGNFLPMGGKRTLILLALRHLHENAPAPVDVLPLARGAPFGRVAIDVAGCTLCLACVGACPTGALLEDPDRPKLAFNEEACVQCGLCRSTCPESVVTLEPRLRFAAAAPVTLKEEEPYHCVRCGKPFATRATVERVVAQLAGKHSMFLEGDHAARIRMCDDCRVIVQFEDPNTPLASRPRPLPRTTADYLRERELQEERRRLKAEFEASKEASEKDREAAGGDGGD